MLIIEFGSSKRGDLDSSSDRDVLIIGNNWHELSEERATRKRYGYSVSCFTRDRALYLVSTGNLFFKHIKDEGVLVSGPEEEYSQLMATWRPAASYTHEIEQNLDLLEVLAFTPHSHWGIAVAIDIISSSVRNILIRRLATFGIYVFAWEGILETAATFGQIRHNDVELFLFARRIKNMYRKGQLFGVGEAFLNDLSEAAARVFRIGNFVYFNSRKNIRSLPEQFLDGSYKQLRGLELLCAEYAFEPALARYSEWVKEPSTFCASRHNNSIHTISY